jgi:hypothetical protein
MSSEMEYSIMQSSGGDSLHGLCFYEALFHCSEAYKLNTLSFVFEWVSMLCVCLLILTTIVCVSSATDIKFLL